MEELDRNLNSWDAVILDAKMFDESEDETPKLDGLRKAIRHIDQLSMKKSIPYFISTGQPDLMGNEMFTQSFGHFYIKERDDLQLIEDLKKQLMALHGEKFKFYTVMQWNNFLIFPKMPRKPFLTFLNQCITLIYIRTSNLFCTITNYDKF